MEVQKQKQIPPVYIHWKYIQFHVTATVDSMLKWVKWVIPNVYFCRCRWNRHRHPSLSWWLLEIETDGFSPWFCDGGVAWWRHQMETFSALLALCAGNSPVPVNSPHKGQWRGALTFSLICVWINGWVNNRGAGDLRRHRGHYDVIEMRQSRAKSWTAIICVPAVLVVCPGPTRKGQRSTWTGNGRID